MNIESKTYHRKTRLIHMGYGTKTEFFNIETPLSNAMTKKLVKYALNRLDEDLRELVISKDYKVVVNRHKGSDNELIGDSDYQVDFISKNGLMISVDYILLNKYNNPHIDHGLSLAEDQ